MRSKNSLLMNDILKYINTFYQSNFRYPSIREIGMAVGSSAATVQRYLHALDEDGLIEYDGRIRNTEQNRKSSTGYYSYPVMGCVSCGVPTLEEDNVIEYVTLPESMFGRPSGGFGYYILKASGDSMVDAGINDGDYIIIRYGENLSIRIGDLIVALDETGSNTLKRYEGVDENGEYFILGYMNKEMYPDQVLRIPVGAFRVQGVAVRTITSRGAICEE